MRAFTAQRATLEEGILISPERRIIGSEKYQTVQLEQRGVRRRMQTILVSQQQPPVIKGRRIYEAAMTTVWHPDADKFFYEFQAPEDDDNSHCLIRIKTKWKHHLGTHGNWSLLGGNISQLLKGLGAHGECGDEVRGKTAWL